MLKKPFISSLVVLCCAFLSMSDSHAKKREAPKLVYSTYLGGSGADGVNDWLRYFSLGPAGTIDFASSTDSPDFPVTATAYGKTYNGGDEQW